MMMSILEPEQQVPSAVTRLHWKLLSVRSMTRNLHVMVRRGNEEGHLHHFSNITTSGEPLINNARRTTSVEPHCLYAAGLVSSGHFLWPCSQDYRNAHHARTQLKVTTMAVSHGYTPCSTLMKLVYWYSKDFGM